MKARTQETARYLRHRHAGTRRVATHHTTLVAKEYKNSEYLLFCHACETAMDHGNTGHEGGFPSPFTAWLRLVSSH